MLLGLDPSSQRTPQELQVEQQRLQLFQQMQQKGRDVAKYLRGGDTPQVFLAVNHRIAHTPVAPLLVLAGGVLLRFVIVSAGQLSSWQPV